MLTGLLAGSITATLLVLFPQARPWEIHAGVYGLAVNVIGLVVVSLAGSGPAARDRSYLERARG